MARKIEVGFEVRGIRIPLDQLFPLRKTNLRPEEQGKLKCIVASIKEIGVIEPLIVYPQEGRAGRSGAGGYIILDGNIRYAILKDMKKPDAFCLIATDDEAYTYNHKVNNLSPIQEHFMILRAIEQGVSEEKIASTLAVDVLAIRKKRNLLDGICPEAVSLLKDRKATAESLRELRRVVPMRQIEIAELMCDLNCFSGVYAHSLYTATPEDQRLAEFRQKKDDVVDANDRERLRREMQNLHRELKVVEETYSDNALNLVVAARYVQSLLENGRVLRYLTQHHAELVRELKKIGEAPEVAGIDARVTA